MEYTTLVLMLALAQYLFFAMKTGFYRGKYNVEAPKCTGDENFERMFRIQQNTMEQLIVYIPALFAFSVFVNPYWGAGIGVFFIIGRFVYFNGYLNDPKKRGPGMIMTMLTNVVLVVGAIVGCVLRVV